MAFRAIRLPNVEVKVDGEARDQMEKQLQAIVTVLSLVNPLICGAMFAQIDAGQSRAIQLADATKVALAVLVILVVAALMGARVLQVFGISLQSFSIASGGVVELDRVYHDARSITAAAVALQGWR